MYIYGDLKCDFCENKFPYIKNKTPFAFKKHPFSDKVYFCSECNDKINCNTDSGVLCVVHGCQHLKEVDSLYCTRHDENSLPIINSEIQGNFLAELTEKINDRGCCSNCGEGLDNEEEWKYNTECELCGHPIPDNLINKKDMGIIRIGEYDSSTTKNIHMKESTIWDMGRNTSVECYEWHLTNYNLLPENKSSEYEIYNWTDLGPATEEEIAVLKKFKVII